MGTSGIKTLYITDDLGIQYHTLLESDLAGKTLAQGLTPGFGDGIPSPAITNTATFSNGAKAYTWIRDVLTPTYIIDRVHYVFTTQNVPHPVYTCVNIGPCNTEAVSLNNAIAKQAWIRNNGYTGSIRLKSANQAEVLVTDSGTRANSMYIINYELIGATTSSPERIVFSTTDINAKKALTDYFDMPDGQLAWYEYDGQVVRGKYQPPVKSQASNTYQYNKIAVNDLLTKWSPVKLAVLD